MSPTSWVLIFTISCAVAMKNNAPHRTSLRSALNGVGRKQSDLEINPANYGSLRTFKHHGEQADFDQLNDEELLNDFMPENGQEETIGDGFQNVHDSLGSADQAYLKDYLRRIQLQDQRPSSNFRERERSRIHAYPSDPREDIVEELVEELLEEQAENEYGIPREVRGDSRYEYKMASGESFDPKMFSDRNEDDNWRNYYGQEQEYYPAFVPAVERRNVNSRYPIGRDFRNYHDMAKRFPVAKRSPKPMTKKRQVTDPKVVH